MLLCSFGTGQHAHLIIYDDGKEVEVVQLYHLKTKEEMHQLFQDKGFRKKTKLVLEEEQRVRDVEKDISTQQQLQPVYSRMFKLYGIVFFVTMLFALLIRWRGKSHSRRRAASASTMLPLRV